MSDPLKEFDERDKRRKERLDAHGLLMDLFCEVYNPSNPYSPFCSHGEYGELTQNCPRCELWERIKDYAKNSKDSADL